MATVGILNPGQMGSSVGAALVSAGNSVCWASQGRSQTTVERATQSGIVDVGTIDALCNKSEFLFSVCPPDQALSLAGDIAANGFKDTFVDCNAVSPGTSASISEVIRKCGATMVDGGIIGPPAWCSDTTRLYLSGDEAASVAALFRGSMLQAKSLGSETGSASALKMAYAGWTKGSAALLMTMYTMAKAQNVEGALLEEWSLSQQGLSDKLNSAIVGNAPKAWRFVGEMNEIASTLQESGLPREWFDAASNVYSRLDNFKNANQVNPDVVIETILGVEE